MTVNDLIEQLIQLPDDFRELPVRVDSASGEYGYQDVEVIGHTRATNGIGRGVVVLTSQPNDACLRTLYQAPFKR